MTDTSALYVTKADNRLILILAFIYFIYDFLILVSNYVGTTVQVIWGGVCFIIVLIMTTKQMKSALFSSLVLLLPLTINSSYRSVIGVDYSSFPITWFLIGCLILVFLSVRKGRINILSIICSICFLVYFLLMTLIINNSIFVNAFNQFVNIFVIMLIISVLPNICEKWNSRLQYWFVKLYGFAVLSYSLMIIFQFYMYSRHNTILGNITFMDRRVSFGATMGDFSFSTLYIASGISLLLALLINETHFFSKPSTVLMLVLYSVAMTIVNARTGIVALALSLVIMFSSYILIHKKYKLLLLEVVVILLIAIGVRVMMSSRGGLSLFGDTGRMDTYRYGLETFSNNMLFGVGFGVVNYTNTVGHTIPHNIVLQYLAQFGLIGFTIIFISMLPILRSVFHKENTCYVWPLVTVLIGAMLIPDIVSSHYFTVLVLLSVCSLRINQKTEKGIT